jgi:hypothetical protein
MTTIMPMTSHPKLLPLQRLFRILVAVLVASGSNTVVVMVAAQQPQTEATAEDVEEYDWSEVGIFSPGVCLILTSYG